MTCIPKHIILSYFFIFNISFLCFSKQNGLDPSKDISQYNFDLWTSKDSLPTNGAMAITQTKDGYIWIGTFDGLVRFDGVKLKIYNKKTSSVFLSNTFIKFFEDDSSLWIGSHSGGLIQYKNNNWNVFTKENGLPGNVIESVFRDSQGTLWVGSTSGPAYFSDGKFTQDNIPDSLKVSTIYDIAEDHKYNLWMTTNGKGIYKYNMNTKKFIKRDNLGGVVARDILSDREGNIWAATDEGLYLFRNDGNLKIFTTKDGLINDNIGKVYQDSRGSIWVGTLEGLSRYYNKEFSSFKSNAILTRNNVTDITEDTEGNLWVTTYRSGFYRLKDGKFMNFTTRQGLSGKISHGVFQDKDNSILIATSNGVSRFHQGKISKYTFKTPSKSNTVKDVFRDSRGILWVTTSNGLIMEKPNGQQKVFYTKHGLSNNNTRMMLEDSNGAMWFGTTSGLNKYENGKFTILNQEKGLSNDFILSLYEDSKKNLWIGTKEGLNKITNGKIINTYTSKDGLTGDVIFQIHEDEDGYLWIGANGGLTRFKNGNFFPYTTKEGLFANSAFQIIEDSNNKFWITCSEGVYTVTRKELNELANGHTKKVKSTYYGKADGMINNNCTANAKSIISKDGNIWFPTYDGVTVIDPTHLSINKVAPPVIIEDILLDNKHIDIQKKVIEVPAEVQRIKFVYTCLSFKASSKVKFRYILKGFDKRWQHITTMRDVSYTNLPPGEFVFNVIAKNNDDIWNKEGDSITIIKQPFFYQTILFKVFIVIMVISILTASYFWRVSRIAAKNRNLKKIVARRTKELQIKNDTLQQLNEEKNSLIQIVAHDLKNPLAQVKGLANLLLIDSSSYSPEQSEYVKKIFGVTERLNKMIIKILDVDAIESGKANINFEKVNISEKLKEVIDSFGTIAENKNISLNFENSIEPLFIEVDPSFNYQVLENLISNAIKFSAPYQSVYVSIENILNNKVRIKIKDEGPGISEEDMPKLFGKFQKLSSRPTGGEHSVGLGLSIVKKYTEAMGGIVWCESKKGAGATFFLEYNLSNSSELI